MWWLVKRPSTVTSRISRWMWSVIVEPSCSGCSETRNLRLFFSEMKRSNGIALYADIRFLDNPFADAARSSMPVTESSVTAFFALTKIPKPPSRQNSDAGTVCACFGFSGLK